MSGLIFADPDMQSEIDTHISEGQATFNVLMLVGWSYANVLTCLFLFIPNFPLQIVAEWCSGINFVGLLCFKMVFDREQHTKLVLLNQVRLTSN